MKPNQSVFTQFSMFNSLASLPERTVNWLISTWAFPFRVFIYPLIRPELFNCLYSTVDSRPATPPQIIVSLLIIQAMFNKTDDEMHDWMMGGDVAIRFATNTLGFSAAKLPTCDKQLTRFRQMNREYAEANGCKSPLDKCLEELQFGMWALMGLPLSHLRVDSTQIAANIARLTRESLLYRANLSMLRSIEGIDGDEMQKKLKEAGLSHYFEQGDENQVLYHSHISKNDKRNSLVTDADQILALCTQKDLETESGKLYTTVLSQQTVVEDGKRRFARPEDHVMNSQCVQNLSDPEATFRNKAGEDFIGYVLNFVEAVGSKESQVISWTFDQNIQTDPVMAMAFMTEAKTIIEGVERYNQLFGIKNPGNMERCQEVLQHKMEVVKNAIFEAKRLGHRVPRSFEDCLSIDEFHADDDSQMRNTDELLESYGIITMDDLIPEKDGENQNAGVSSNETKTADGTDKMPAPTLNKVIESVMEQQNVPETDATDAASPISSPSDQSTDSESKTVASSETDMQEEIRKAKLSGGTMPVPGIVILPDGWKIHGVDGPAVMKTPEFANLNPEIRREAILQTIREKMNKGSVDLKSVTIMAADGAYSLQDLLDSGSEHGITVLPTDLFGKKTNPIVGLFTFDEEKRSVLTCPMGKRPLEQKSYANGTIRLQMPDDACHSCPFRNDCRVKHQPRKGTFVLSVSSNAYSRVLCEAFIRTDWYKDVGRFRNGVETIPAFLHNVLDIDHLPIGRAIKEVYMAGKITALNIRKFIMFVFGQGHIAANPLLT